VHGLQKFDAIGSTALTICGALASAVAFRRAGRLAPNGVFLLNTGLATDAHPALSCDFSDLVSVRKLMAATGFGNEAVPFSER
jgi:hypothetical protein